jgi:hypothetical protein
MPMEVINLVPEGFKTYGARTIGYVKDGKLYLNSPEMRIMVENEAQIAELAAQLPPGTTFFLPGSQSSWQTGSDGEPSENKISGMFYLDPSTMNLFYSQEGE